MRIELDTLDGIFSDAAAAALAENLRYSDSATIRALTAKPVSIFPAATLLRVSLVSAPPLHHGV